MARAVQRITLERGFDPREFTLVPFGGAGGLHAARLAEQLGLRQILVPTMPGLLSAMGMLCAAPLYAFSQGVMLRLTPERAPLLESEPAVRGALEKLQALAHSALAADGVPQAEWVLRFSADLRYAGQSYELIVPLGAGDPLATFARQHRELYGYDAPERDVEVVAVRLLAGGTPRDVALPELSQRPSRFAPEQCGAPVALLTEGKAVAAWRFQRDALCAGDVITGPAMVAEYSGATLIPPGWRARVNEYGMLLMEQAGPEGGADD
jgi:N-methylhydantoinase A